MEIESKNKKKKIEELINSKLIFKVKDFECFKEMYTIIIRTTKKAINQIYKSEIYKKDIIGKIKFIKKDFLYCNLIILLLILTTYKIICQNFIILEDSIITLKVSNSGEQKIFNSDAKLDPDIVYIDGNEQTQEYL